MNTKELTNAKRLATDIFLLDGDPDDFEAADLIQALKVADDLYFNDQESFITDEQYDFIKRIAEKMDPYNTYFIGVGSEVRGGKVKLPFSMGSLTQSYEGDVEKWVNKYKVQKEKIVISDKMDGVSALILYDNGELQIAYSRGDGTEGADITRHVRRITCVPRTISDTEIKAIRAEIIISEPNFKKLNELGLKSRNGEPYKNARNAIAGLMNAESNPGWVYDYIDVITYEIVSPNFHSKSYQFHILSTVGFKTAPTMVLSGIELTDAKLIEIINTRRAASPFAIDGIVLEIDSETIRKRVNPTKETLNPEYARKYKVASEDNVAIATVVDVHWNVSKTGYLKPRVEIEPVELVGVTVTFATGFNAKFIYENKVGPGAKVRITRSGDVIPYITDVIEPMRF